MPNTDIPGGIDFRFDEVKGGGYSVLKVGVGVAYTVLKDGDIFKITKNDLKSSGDNTTAPDSEGSTTDPDSKAPPSVRSPFELCPPCL